MIGSQPRFFSWYGYTGGCDQVAGIEDNFDQVPGFSPRITALLAQLQNDTSGDLNPACKRMTRAAAKPKVGTRIGSRDSLLKMRLQKNPVQCKCFSRHLPNGPIQSDGLWCIGRDQHMLPGFKPILCGLRFLFGDFLPKMSRWICDPRWGMHGL